MWYSGRPMGGQPPTLDILTRRRPGQRAPDTMSQFVKATRVRFYVGEFTHDLRLVTPERWSIVRKHVGLFAPDGWTEYVGTGNWEGGDEGATVFESIQLPPPGALRTPALWKDAIRRAAKATAHWIAGAAEQACVLVTVEGFGFDGIEATFANAIEPIDPGNVADYDI